MHLLGYLHFFTYIFLKGIVITHLFSFSFVFSDLRASKAEVTLPVGFYSLWSWLFEEVISWRSVTKGGECEGPAGRVVPTHTSAGSTELNFSKYLHFSSCSPVLILPYGSHPYNQDL